VEAALFLHILGASILVGGLLTAFVAQLLGWSERPHAAAVTYARLGFRALLYAAMPGWLLMRVGAQWIWSEQGWDDVPEEPLWLGVGWFTGDLGLLPILLATIFAGVGARRLGPGSEGKTALVRVAAVLAGITLVAYVLTVWAMSAKPD
jgi:hypothetical protein